ncbi:lipoyl protein ligase domain-containing protein [Staphylococcus aureus]
MCFDAPSWYELVVEGRNIAGSAQTRQKGVILQHGSILQDIDIDELFDMFIYKNERLKLKMKEAFVKKQLPSMIFQMNTLTISQMEEAFRERF